MSSPNSPTVVTRLRVFAKTSKGFRTTRLHRTFSAAHSYAARMDLPGSSPDGDVDQEIVTVRTNSPRMRRTRRSPAASGLSSGRRGPKVVNFKSPPRAVFKSSAAARQACAPGTVICIPVRFHRPSAPRRAWQAVVKCLPLSDKAASAHVAALSHCQRYEPTGNATCPVGRHALGLAFRRASALIPKPVLPCCPQKRCTARSQSRSYRLPWTCRPRALACGQTSASSRWVH